MTMHVQRQNDAIQVRTPHLELVLHLESLAMELRSASGATRIAGLRPRVITERGALLASEPVLDGYGQIRTRAGLATRLHVESRLSSRLWLQLDLDVAPDWPGVAIGMEVSNRGLEPVRVDALEPCWWSRDRADGELELSHPSGSTQLLEMGFHSDARSRWRRLGSTPWLQPFSRAPVEDRGPFTPAPAWGLQVSDFVTVLRSPEREGLVLGFISHDRFLSFTLARSEGSQLQELTGSCFTEALHVLPRSRLRAERVWIGLDLPEHEGLATWAARAGREMQAPVPGRDLMGGFAPGAPSASAVLEVLGRVGGYGFARGTLDIGPEYAAAPGDWHEASASFPDGLAPLAQEIRATGLEPRLWLAPFLVAPDSGVARREPGWILRDVQGDPIPARLPVSPGGPAAWVLDVSHPEVVDWMRKLGDSVRGLGFDRIALAHLDAATQPGARSRSEQGTAEAYRNALRALRGPVDAGSPGGLLGQRAPLGPSIGLLDRVRCGPDWGPRWSPRLGPRGVDPAGSAEVAVRNALVRAPLHQRLWVQELGPLPLGDPGSQLDAWERVSIAALAAACGSPAVLGGDCDAALDRESLELLRQLWPASGRAPEGISMGRSEGLLSRYPDGSLLLLLLNFSRRSRSLVIDPARLGLPEPAQLDAVRIWDILDQKFLEPEEGREAGRLNVPDVPGHGCVWLRITPIDDRPRVVGSTLHLCGGVLDASRARLLDSGALALRLQLPGPRSGEVFVAHSRQAPLGACVAFTDDLEFAIAEAQHLSDRSRSD